MSADQKSRTEARPTASLRAENRIPRFERLEIETLSSCNRSCWFCPRTYDRSGKYFSDAGVATVARMPSAKVLELLDQAQDLGFRGLVAFHFYSEPLLDKRNIFFAEKSRRRRGMRPYLHTNGDALRTSDALCDQVRRVYEFVVIGLYDYVTIEDLDIAKDYWRRRLAGTDLKFSYIRPIDDRALPSLGIPRALVPTDARAATPDLTFENGPCNRPLLRMLICYDGAFCLCCEDIHAQYGLGSVYDASLEELWYSERHERVVRDLLAGKRADYDLCRRCPMIPTGPLKTGATRIAQKKISSVRGT